MSNHQLHSQSLFILCFSLALCLTHPKLPTDTQLERHRDTNTHTHTHTHTQTNAHTVDIGATCQALSFISHDHNKYYSSVITIKPETPLLGCTSHKQRLQEEMNPYVHVAHMSLISIWKKKKACSLSTLMSLFIHLCSLPLSRRDIPPTVC